MRVLKVSMRSIAAIIGLIAVVLYWLAFTSSGLGFVLNRVTGVSVEGAIEGSLVGRSEMAKLKVEVDGVAFTIERVAIDWQPFYLLSGLLKINELKVTDLDGHSYSSEQVLDAQPDSQLPFDLELGQLSATDLKWRHAEQSPYSVEKLNLSLGLQSSMLDLYKLEISHNGDEISASGKADISLIDNGLVDLVVDYRVASLPALTPPLSGTLSLAGSWVSMRLDNQTQAPYASRSLGQALGAISDEPELDLVSTITEFSLAAVNGGDLNGEVRVKGTFDSSALEANLRHVHLGEIHDLALSAGAEGKLVQLNTLTVNKVLEAGDFSESLVIKGSIGDYTQPKLSAISLLASWSNLDFLNSSYQSPLPASQGNLLLEGTADQYSFNLESTFESKQFSTLKSRVNGVGSLSTIDTQAISLEGDGLSLSAQLSTNFDDSQASVTLTDLKGNLHDEEIAGHAKLTVLSDFILVDDLVLTAGGAEVKANGNLGFRNGSKLDWSFSAPNLNLFDSRLGGSVVASGKLTGALSRPVIQATVSTNLLNIDQWFIASANAQLNMGFETSSAWAVDISTSQIAQGSQAWLDSAALRISGTLEQHDAELKAVFADTPESQLRWQGQYQNQTLDFSGNIFNLPAQASQVFTKDLSFQAGGMVNGALNGSYKAGASLELQSQISSEQITLASKTQRSADLIFEQVQIDLNAGSDIELTVSAAFDGAGKLEGHVLLEDTLLSSDLQNADVAGQFKLNYSHLDSFSTLLPPGINVDGNLTLDAGLAGTLAWPKLTLNGVLKDGLLNLKEEGVAISDIRLDVASLSANKFSLTGSSTSGAGSINLTGNIGFEDTKQLALDLQLLADNAMFLQSPLVKAEGDANMNIKLIDNVLDVTGRIDVDKADIKIGSSLSAVTESPDLILLGSEPRPNALRLKINIALNLGESTAFSARGLTGKLVGTPSISLGDLGLLTSVGEIKVVEGKFDILGQSLEIDRGIVSYAGGAISNPLLLFEATKTIDDTRAGIKIEGNVDAPEITLFSKPSYEDQDILALVFFDKKLDQLSTSDSFKLISIADALRGGSFNAKIIAINDEIADYLGVDKFDVSFDSNDDQRKLQVSSRINSKLDIGYAYNFISSLQALFLRYKINDHWSIQSSVDVESGADLKYKIERD
jgi:translocation and assembly module TamB